MGGECRGNAQFSVIFGLNDARRNTHVCRAGRGSVITAGYGVRITSSFRLLMAVVERWLWMNRLGDWNWR